MKTRHPGAAIRAIAHEMDRDMSYLAFAYQMLAPVDHTTTSWDEQVSRYAQLAAIRDRVTL